MEEACGLRSNQAIVREGEMIEAYALISSGDKSLRDGGSLIKTGCGIG
jgi:hypothetical protein